MAGTPHGSRLIWIQAFALCVTMGVLHLSAPLFPLLKIQDKIRSGSFKHGGGLPRKFPEGLVLISLAVFSPTSAAQCSS